MRKAIEGRSGLGFKVQSLGFRFRSRYQVQVEFWGFWFWVSGLGYGALIALRVERSGVGFWVLG